MRKVFVVLLVYFVIGYLVQGISARQYSCQWSGLKGCECNIIGACFKTGRPKHGLDDKLSRYSPQGLDQFRYTKSTRNPSNLAYLCESNTVAIMYDCNARIPLYAATMMTGAQLTARYYPPPRKRFRQSGDPMLTTHFQQQNEDYDEATVRNICYECRGRAPPRNYLVDVDWWRAHSGKTVRTQQPCISPYSMESAVNRGHLIAASYGRGDQAKIRATFTFTNAVPQFAIFNSGKWLSSEKRLITWGQNNCNQYGRKGTRNVQMYIVVGTVPSTYRSLKPRFFGKSGFSNFEGRSSRTSTYGQNTINKETYRVNVPRFMWTAACCTFQYKDIRGQSKDGTRSTAFYRENDPGKKRCDIPLKLSSLFTSMGLTHLATIDLFPMAHFKCYASSNYVSN